MIEVSMSSCFRKVLLNEVRSWRKDVRLLDVGMLRWVILLFGAVVFLLRKVLLEGECYGGHVRLHMRGCCIFFADIATTVP
jgi:hypothetical protein